MARALHSGIAGIILAVTPLVVVAQQGTKPYPDCTRQPSDSDTSAAKGAFQAGQVSFNEADYDRAITYWEDAYRRDCTAHAMLLNLARAYELNGNPRQAVVALETYLARNPSSPQRDQIARRVEVLKDKIAALPAVPETSEPVATTEPTGTAAPTTTATAPPDRTDGGSKPILPLIVVGVGGVVAIVGGVLYLDATSDYNDAKDECGGTKGCSKAVEEKGDDAVSRQNLSTVIGLGGLAIAAAGLVWYLVSPTDGATESAAPRERKRPDVSPVIGPGFAGLSLGGSF
jgi:tetratricopeptide (TPR) repeat protein